MNPLPTHPPVTPALPTPAADAAAPVAAPVVDPAFRAKATQAAQKFEAYLVGQMLHQMRRSTRELASEDSPLRNRVNDDMLDLADTLVADTLAGQHAFGIADAILRQVLPQAAVPPAADRFKSAATPVALDSQPQPPASAR